MFLPTAVQVSTGHAEAAQPCASERTDQGCGKHCGGGLEKSRVSQALPQLKEILGWDSNSQPAHILKLTSPLFFHFITLTLYRLRSIKVPEETDVEATPVQDGGEGEPLYHPPEITTLYSVSARLEPLFLDAKKRCVCVFLTPTLVASTFFAWFRQQGDIAGRVQACVSTSIH